MSYKKQHVRDLVAAVNKEMSSGLSMNQALARIAKRRKTPAGTLDQRLRRAGAELVTERKLVLPEDRQAA